MDTKKNQHFSNPFPQSILNVNFYKFLIDLPSRSVELIKSIY